MVVGLPKRRIKQHLIKLVFVFLLFEKILIFDVEKKSERKKERGGPPALKCFVFQT
jgi:hypothetical protein